VGCCFQRSLLLRTALQNARADWWCCRPDVSRKRRLAQRTHEVCHLLVCLRHSLLLTLLWGAVTHVSIRSRAAACCSRGWAACGDSNRSCRLPRRAAQHRRILTCIQNWRRTLLLLLLLKLASSRLASQLRDVRVVRCDHAIKHLDGGLHPCADSMLQWGLLRLWFSCPLLRWSGRLELITKICRTPCCIQQGTTEGTTERRGATQQRSRRPAHQLLHTPADLVNCSKTPLDQEG
jgi:hypothetical protein